MPDKSRSDAGDVLCAACGSRGLRAGSDACPSCNAVLDAECGGCGALLAERSRFCGQCGAPRAKQAKAAGSAGRRQLTVMFCDLAGYTELSRALDLEQLGVLVSAYQEACTGPVNRFGGTVAQYLGDGLLVYFGFPQAHEDDAVRAAHAAREILAALPAALAAAVPRGTPVPSFRIGIHTGPVVVDRVGSGARQELLAMGATVNLAARLQSKAPPGGALISAATAALLDDAFELEPLGPVELKGFEKTVDVCRLGAATTPARRAQAPGRERHTLIGRAAELETLLDAFGGAQRGEGRVAWIQAEPGLGKSRLVEALREALPEEAHHWIECGCSAFQTNTAFHPFEALLREELGLDGGPVGDDAMARLGASLGGKLEPLGVAAVASLLGADDPLVRAHDLPDPKRHSPDARREHTLSALTAWLTRADRSATSVLVIEDLHWADPSSLELIERLVAAAPGARLLLLVTSRPEFEPGWPEQAATRLVLRHLEASEVKELVRIVAPDALDPDRLAAVVLQSDGVPLFAEELARSAAESGDLAVPPSLHDSLMARLDRLGPARDLAQLAATLGRDFSVDVLRAAWTGDAAAIPRLLARLVEADLLVPDEHGAGERYRFRHALFQDVAYESLLHRTRRDLHGRIAQVAEEQFTGSPIAEPHSLARHLEAAGRLEDAVRQLHIAGEMAAGRSALREAIAFLERALGLLEALEAGGERDALELELQMALGAPLQGTRGYADPEVVRTYERALALCDSSDGDRRRGDVLWGLFSFNLVRGSFATAGRLADELDALAGELGDSGLALAAHNAVGSVRYFEGRYGEAFDELERAVALYDPERHGALAYVRGQDHAVSSQVCAGIAAWMLGRPRTAAAEVQAAVARAREIGHPLTLGFSLGYSATVAALRRRPDEVRALCDELIALADVQCLPVWAGLGRLLQGWALCGTAEDAKGTALLVQGVVQSSGTGASFEAPFLSTLMADAHLRGGRVKDAERSLDMGAALAARNGSPYADAELARMRGECLLARTESDDGRDEDEEARQQAEQAFARATEIARAQQAPGLELRARMSAARLYLATGRGDAARSALEGAEGLWAEPEAGNPDLLDLAALRSQVGLAG